MLCVRAVLMEEREGPLRCKTCRDQEEEGIVGGRGSWDVRRGVRRSKKE